ncbi:MAG: efflux RND transporter permease subunit [Candidatus Zhuqueibacterota bacterium]
MRLPQFAIQNHQFSMIIIILLILSGIVSFLTMPRSEDPTVTPPGTSVIVIFPGANPVDLEELVIDPIEEVINELEDIKELVSSAEDGLAVINVEFNVGSDADDKYADVVQKVNSIRNNLPAEILQLDMIKWSISDVKILQTALISESASYRALEKEADRLKKQLERVPGVKKIEIGALPRQQVLIAVDLERLAQVHIPLNRIIGAIQTNNLNIPGGNIDIGNKRFNIQTSGSYSSLDEIRNTVIDASGQNLLYLKDLATVSYSYEDQQYRARFNGKRAIFLTANQKDGTNIYQVMGGIKTELDKFARTLPATMTIENVFDQSQSVSYRLNGFFSNLLQGLILVGVVMLLAVNIRAAIIVMLAIPVSILMGVTFIDFSGYGLQQMTIAGLVIALGMLVDNAIVVTDNVTRFMKMGYSKTEAAIQGTQQVGWAVTSSTITTVLAFVPMMMMQNVTGDFIRSMPLIVVYTLFASLFVSLTQTPYLASKFINVANGDRESRFRRMINWFIETKYRKTLAYALEHPRLILVTALIVFFLSLSLFPFIGVSFFPKAEKPQLLINIELPEGTSLDRTDEIAQKVESVIAARKDIKLYAANVGKGNPRIYYNVIARHEKSNYAQIFVELIKNDLALQSQVVAELRQEFSTYAGVAIEVKEFEQGPPVEAPIAIRLLGENLEVLKATSRDIEDIIHGTEGTVNIYNPLKTTKADLHVKINKAKAGLLGIPLAEIDRTVRAAINGLTVSKFRDDEGKEYDIVIRMPIDNKPTIKEFDRIFVTSVTGAQIPLKQVAAIEFQSTPISINHYKLERSVTITADVISGYSVNDVTMDILGQLEKYQFPKGYRYYAGGELESREESFGGMMQAIIIAMVGIMAVLVLQFRSYSQPLIVFSTIPLAIIGSLVALFITGNNFSFTAFVGLTSLIGIVVNNAIILVDFANQLRAEGKDVVTALKETGELRFTPIILTSGTTVGGLLPLTLRGGTMWAPMGWTIIGGLTMSTILTLVIVPVLYKVFTKEIGHSGKA